MGVWREKVSALENSRRIFLHGLDSSGQGTKGRWFGERYPDMERPDFTGSLDERMLQCEGLWDDRQSYILVGSSFGGLMAALFAREHPEACRRLILLAPAFNFEAYTPPPQQLPVETFLFIGRYDTVTPPEIVVPLAEKSFANISTHLVADDHMLQKSFSSFPWQELLEPR